MDIIASHQMGLVEQLEAEAVALAGRPRDAGQRAIVYHHVADMTGLAHGYALLAARGALEVDPAVAAMERQVRRAWWELSRAERVALGERVAVFGEALRAIDGARCVAVLMAYRMTATPGLGGQAAKRLDAELVAALGEVQGAGSRIEVRRRLFVAHARWVGELIGARIDEAVAALDWPLKWTALGGAVAALRIPIAAFERAERRGMKRVEATLRRSKMLPAPFASNPAQAFFRLQRQVGERRRREADGDHLSPDDAVSLAA